MLLCPDFRFSPLNTKIDDDYNFHGNNVLAIHSFKGKFFCFRFVDGRKDKSTFLSKPNTIQKDNERT